jgi:hypothetical protein
MDGIQCMGRIFYDLYFLANIIRLIRSNKNGMGWECGTYCEERNAYRFLVGRDEGRRPLGRYRPRW